MSLVEHTRREMTLLGEDTDVIEWMISVVEKFAEFGHSGGSASILIPQLNQLLQYETLTPLTCDPHEWQDWSEISGAPVWQNKRNSKAFSEDGGKTYWLVDGPTNPRPYYHSVPLNDKQVL